MGTWAGRGGASLAPELCRRARLSRAAVLAAGGAAPPRLDTRPRVGVLRVFGAARREVARGRLQVVARRTIGDARPPMSYGVVPHFIQAMRCQRHARVLRAPELLQRASRVGEGGKAVHDVSGGRGCACRSCPSCPSAVGSRELARLVPYEKTSTCSWPHPVNVEIVTRRVGDAGSAQSGR